MAAACWTEGRRRVGARRLAADARLRGTVRQRDLLGDALNCPNHFPRTIPEPPFPNKSDLAIFPHPDHQSPGITGFAV
eukprot:gene14726-biopygen9659